MQTVLVLAILVLIIMQFVLFIRFTYKRQDNLLKPITIVFILIAILIVIFISAF